MNINEEILKNKRYKEQIDQLGNDTLLLIAKDHIKALKAAHKGIKQKEPDRLNDIEYLQAVADGMQKLAKLILEERSNQ